MPTKPKVQHWVPQFYLRHFATPDSKGNRALRFDIAPAPSRNSSRDRRDAQVVFYEDCPKDEQGNPLIVEIEYRGEVKPFDASGYAEYRDASPERIQQMFVDQIASNAIALAEMLLTSRRETTIPSPSTVLSLSTCLLGTFTDEVRAEMVAWVDANPPSD